jgi:hypothetical protein
VPRVRGFTVGEPLSSSVVGVLLNPAIMNGVVPSGGQPPNIDLCSWVVGHTERWQQWPG